MDTNTLLSGLNLDSRGFKQLYDTQSLVDCTLACEGGKLSAHKVVLSACSNYLAKILLEHPVEHPIIILPDLNIEDVKTLVHYMYTGELLKSNTLHSTSLLKTAAMLSVNSLNDFINGTTNNNNTTNNATNLYFGSSNTTTTANPSNGGKLEYEFSCPVCKQANFGKSGTSGIFGISGFEEHMRQHGVTSFGCEICHKPFASLRYVLTNHMRRCHGWKAEQKLQC